MRPCVFMLVNAVFSIALVLTAWAKNDSPENMPNDDSFLLSNESSQSKGMQTFHVAIDFSSF